ncbi:MAG: SulP family inorganic anion transporter [Erythrobacter sp.]
MAPATASRFAPASIGRDILASIVVFLMALPRCKGNAIASGAPPALGLITGIVGGLEVGSLAGPPLQASGAAAAWRCWCSSWWTYTGWPCSAWSG